MRQHTIPFELLLDHATDYTHLRVFGYLCYPSTTTTSPHKLTPHSAPCIFIGYPAETKGYRCYNLSTHRVLTSQHVYFDESSFPFRSMFAATPAPLAQCTTSPCNMVVLPDPFARRCCHNNHVPVACSPPLPHVASPHATPVPTDAPSPTATTPFDTSPPAPLDTDMPFIYAPPSQSQPS
jgi:hypothetical protein